MIVAAADLIAEQETRRLTVASVTRRAGVGPREFHATFSNLEDCLLATFDEGLARLTDTVIAAIPPSATMLAKIEVGLYALLAFLDEEPGWGRLLLIELPTQAQRRRERAIARLARELSRVTIDSLLDPDPPPSERQAARLTTAVLGVIQCHMGAREDQPLLALTPWLMSSMIEPTLCWAHGRSRSEGGADAGRQRARRAPARKVAGAQSTRAEEVLRSVSRNPAASNRQIAQATGVPNDSNVSEHLRRLQRRGMIRNLAAERRRGAPNAWVLTQHGKEAIERTGPESGEGRSVAA